MSNVLVLDRPRAPFRTDVRGMLEQAMSCAIEHQATAVVVTLIDAVGEEFYFASDGAPCPAMLAAMDITRKAVRGTIKS